MSQQPEETTGHRQKVAFITGVTGQVMNTSVYWMNVICSIIHLQDGSYLAELLISKGYIVHGLIRRSSSFNTERVRHLYEDQMAHCHEREYTLRKLRFANVVCCLTGL